MELGALFELHLKKSTLIPVLYTRQESFIDISYSSHAHVDRRTTFTLHKAAKVICRDVCWNSPIHHH